MIDLTSDLFTGPRIREWLPDETLYSLASRQHVISGNWNPTETCTQLFGHPRMGTAHDFPCNLNSLCSRTNWELGSAMDIIRNHTILPFYLPFSRTDVAKNAIASVRSGGIGALKANMGLLASRFGSSHPLKSCSICMEVDIDTHGVAYWHRAHQLPGVWLCPAHDHILRISDVKTTGVGRFKWYLPTNSGHQLPWVDDNQSEQVPEQVLTTLRLFAQCSLATTELPQDAHLSQGNLIEVYRSKIIQLGVMSPSGRLHHERFANLALQLHRNLKYIHEFSTLPTDPVQICNQLTSMLKPERISAHPLRHFVLIVSLFGSWSDFWKSYESRSVLPRVESSKIPINTYSCTKVMDEKRHQFLKTISDGGMSITAASRQSGIDTQTGIIWASMTGVTIARRPKLLTPDKRLQLISALNQGKDKEFIASMLSISVQTVTNVLRSEAGLADRWHFVRHLKIQKRHRMTLAIFSKNCSDTQLQDFRKFAPSSFAWLYRNDRDWLYESSARLAKHVKTNNSNIKWDVRDASLSRLVMNTGLAIKSKSPTKKLTVGLLCAELPGLKPKLSQLKSLPLTRKAISTVIGSPSSIRTNELF